MSSQGPNTTGVAGYIFNQLTIRDSSDWTASKRRRLLALEVPDGKSSFPSDPFQVLSGDRRLEYMFGSFQLGGSNGSNKLCPTVKYNAYVFIPSTNNTVLISVAGDTALLQGPTVTVTGATNAGNNGTFTVVANSGGTLIVTNASAVFEVSSNAIISSNGNQCSGAAFDGNGNPYTFQYRQ
jgi:hypothetical protein